MPAPKKKVKSKKKKSLGETLVVDNGHATLAYAAGDTFVVSTAPFGTQVRTAAGTVELLDRDARNAAQNRNVVVDLLAAFNANDAVRFRANQKKFHERFGAQSYDS